MEGYNIRKLIGEFIQAMLKKNDDIITENEIRAEIKKVYDQKREYKEFKLAKGDKLLK